MSAISIQPWLSVRRGAEAVEFYKKAYAAVELFQMQSDDGAVVAQLSIEGAIFWLSDEAPEYRNYAPESVDGKGSVKMLLVVPDPHAIFAKAVSEGAKAIYDVHEENGWLTGRLVDPFGHHWEICKQLEN